MGDFSSELESVAEVDVVAVAARNNCRIVEVALNFPGFTGDFEGGIGGKQES